MKCVCGKILLKANKQQIPTHTLLLPHAFQLTLKFEIDNLLSHTTVPST